MNTHFIYMNMNIILNKLLVFCGCFVEKCLVLLAGDLAEAQGSIPALHELLN